jgi:putative endonuclease
MSAWFVYVLRCGDGTLYCGVTNDVASRLAAHRAGKGARYTRGRGPLRLVHAEPAEDRSAALRREWQIKRLPRGQKPQGAGRRSRLDTSSPAPLRPARSPDGPARVRDRRAELTVEK